jgi:hypothetical protein
MRGEGIAGKIRATSLAALARNENATLISIFYWKSSYYIRLFFLLAVPGQPDTPIRN